MFIKRFLAPLLGLTLLCTGHAFAGQVGGQINVSLTIVKSCQVAGESSSGSYLVSRRGCESADFQLRNEHGQQLASPAVASEAITRVDAGDAAGQRVVVYW